jgi:SulP family sulfate permease
VPAAPGAGAGLRGDLLGGFTAAVVMLAVEGSFGVVALAPLGAAHAPLAFTLGIYAAIVANVVSVLCRARGPLLTGPSAAMSLLVAPMLAVLIADPRTRLPDGQPDVALLLALVAAGTALAGVIQGVAAVLRVGGITRYAPYPVHAGFMNGVAVLTVIAMLPHVVGATAGGVEALRQARPLPIVVALAAFWIALRPPAWTRPVPSYLTALLAATALHHGLRAAFGDASLGPLLGSVPLHWPQIDALQPLSLVATSGLLRDHLVLLVEFAAAVALTSSVQLLFAGSVVDGVIGKRHGGERELLAQGAANVACGCLGLLPGAGSVTRSKVNLDAGATTARSRLVFGASLLLVFVFASGALRHVPMAVIGGLQLAVALALVDLWTRRATRTIVRDLARGTLPSASLLQNYGAMLLVAGIAVLVSLLHGVAVGILVAMLMFIRSNSRRPVRSIVHGDCRASLKVRPERTAELLRAHGRRIVLVELDGALFFGTADAAAREIERVAREADEVIVEFHRVSEVDATGARLLVQAAHAVRAAGKRLSLASLAPDDPRARILREMDVQRVLGDDAFCADADRALERAENRLLEALMSPVEEHRELRLGETMLGAGLDAGQLDALAARLVERRVAKGQHAFRQGDPADAMFVCMRGQIGIWLPAHGAAERGKRLVSFAAGVVFGEIGLLKRLPRSADAIAEEDAVLLELSRERFDELARERPDVLGKIMLNLSLHLSSRLRTLTDELEAVSTMR